MRLLSPFKSVGCCFGHVLSHRGRIIGRAYRRHTSKISLLKAFSRSLSLPPQSSQGPDGGDYDSCVRRAGAYGTPKHDTIVDGSRGEHA
mmetsp:Transcript_37865/g.91285  ORF Transcript_37865/g.91285 Transcript_37865/m.91285 type:complete len:89 (+) Transcript_37865:2371-2637(+)